ncbi:MAG TPA: protoporphyrinogen oxidase [Vicinamibacteria bacterium]|nr:protoporphyrinogen oxidase [Vicinamibacteria bacterium]
MTKTTVAVIGGGISGLAAAFTLQKRGIPYVLVEAGPALGGVIRTETRDGFLLEGGPDSILAQKPEGLALCRELGLGERLVPTNPDDRSVYILRGGVLHPLPEGMMLAVPTKVGPFLRSRLFSWPGKLRMGLDLLIPGRDGCGDESIASFLRRRFGQEAVERLGEPLLAGIHSGDPERLSILATFPRFRGLEEKHGSLVRGMWRAPRHPRPPGSRPPSAFYSLRCGLRELVDALVLRIPREAIWTKMPVQHLERSGSGYRLHLHRQETLDADRVIVAAPAPRIAPALEPLAPDASRVLAAIPFASTATVLVGYRSEDVAHPLNGYGMVVPKTERLRTAALSFVSSKYPGRAPEGHVLLRGFLGGSRDPSALDLTDVQMVETVAREMTQILGLRGRPVMTQVFRWPLGTPQLEVGHLERMDALERLLARETPGLVVTGAGIRSTGIPDSVAEGTRAAQAAAEGL